MRLCDAPAFLAFPIVFIRMEDFQRLSSSIPRRPDRAFRRLFCIPLISSSSPGPFGLLPVILGELQAACLTSSRFLASARHGTSLPAGCFLKRSTLPHDMNRRVQGRRARRSSNLQLPGSTASATTRPSPAFKDPDGLKCNGPVSRLQPRRWRFRRSRAIFKAIAA